MREERRLSNWGTSCLHIRHEIRYGRQVDFSDLAVGLSMMMILIQGKRIKPNSLNALVVDKICGDMVSHGYFMCSDLSW